MPEMSLIGFENTVALKTDCDDNCNCSTDDERTQNDELVRFDPENGTLIGFGSASDPSEAELEEARALIGMDLDGRYILTEVIGIGNSGVVFQAMSTQIPRPFAVKLVWTGKSTGMRARFENEVSALSRLNNPHIVKIADIVELEGGLSALVMERVRGQTLHRILKTEAPLSVNRVISIARQVTAALASVHEAGLTHCDIKPDNIIIESLPLGGEFVHLIDFDIVQFRRRGPSYDFAGTPRYASPEQARGEPLDETSDIYSFGAVLFTMLTGRPPFAGDFARDLLRQHLQETPPTLAVAGKELEFPPALEDLVKRMLDKNRTNRPQTLAEVISLIEQAAAQLEHLNIAA